MLRFACSRLVGLIALASTPVAVAQETKLEIGARIGTSYYIGDAGRSGIIAPHRPSMVLELRKSLDLRWSLTTAVAGLWLHGNTTHAGNVLPRSTNEQFSTKALAWQLGGEFSWFALSRRFPYLKSRHISPYIGMGLQLAYAWDETNLLAPGAYLSVGIRWLITDRITASACWSGSYLLTDRLDALSARTKWLQSPTGIAEHLPKGGDGYGTLSIGIGWYIGGSSEDECR